MPPIQLITHIRAGLPGEELGQSQTLGGGQRHTRIVAERSHPAPRTSPTGGKTLPMAPPSPPTGGRPGPDRTSLRPTGEKHVSGDTCFPPVVGRPLPAASKPPPAEHRDLPPHPSDAPAEPRPMPADPADTPENRRHLPRPKAFFPPPNAIRHRQPASHGQIPRFANRNSHPAAVGRDFPSATPVRRP